MRNRINDLDLWLRSGGEVTDQEIFLGGRDFRISDIRFHIPHSRSHIQTTYQHILRFYAITPMIHKKIRDTMENEDNRCEI